MSVNPWGKLKGVRPTKLVHYMWDEGQSLPQIRTALIDRYGLDPTKADLLTTIAQGQRGLFAQIEQNPSWVSVYISIPFCPSRCLYCSFISYTLRDNATLRQRYLQVLMQEITNTAQHIKAQGQQVYTIYIGGGTPTSLDEDSFHQLLEHIDATLCTPQTVEFTVEGGRPETISRTKLDSMGRLGVTRVSVNPQSMQACTLNRIGRWHSPKEVVDAAQEVLSRGFQLNMDIIIGLPGEGVSQVEDTVQQVLDLSPHNITVHGLAIKRAAALNLENQMQDLPHPQTAEKMATLTREQLYNKDYIPYYTYRQRNTIANLENVGYSKAGYPCSYNILMMEERMTIYACGAGGVSKVINPALQFTRQTNPKDPLVYIQRLGKSLDDKERNGV